MRGVLAFLLLLLIFIVCLAFAFIGIRRAAGHDGDDTHASTGRHDESARASGQGVRVKACRFLAFVVPNIHKGRNGAKGELFGLSEVVLHGVLMVIVFRWALVRSFARPLVRGRAVGEYSAIGTALVEMLYGLLPRFAIVAIAVPVLFSVVGVDNVAFAIAKRLP